MARGAAASWLVALGSVVLFAACGGTTPTPPAPPGAPSAPANVLAVAGDGAITLSWDPVDGADGYVVYLAAEPGLTRENWASLVGGTRLEGRTSPSLIGSLANGTTYHLLVTAVRTSPAAESAGSAVVSATPTRPVVPGDTFPVTGLAGAISGSGASLHGAFLNPAGYTTTAWFEYGATAGYGEATPGAAYLQAGAIDVSQAVTGLPPLATIHYRLVTRNAGGTFAGADATFTTLAEPEVLLGDLDGATDPVADGLALFWVEVYGGGGLHRYDLAAGAASSIVPFSPFGNGAWLALDPDWVYFGGQGGLPRRVRHDGTGHEPSFCTTGCTTLGGITQLVAHPTGLYVRNGWTDADPPYQIHHYVTRIGLDGTTALRLYERPGDTSTGFGGGLAVDGASVYFADLFRGTVLVVPIGGGPPVTLASGLDHPYDLLLDGTALYVACDDGVRVIDVTSGVQATVYSSLAGFQNLRLAKEGGVIYLSGGGLAALDLASGVATPLAVQPPYSSAAVVAGSSLYWITAGSHFDPPLGRLERIARPP